MAEVKGFGMSHLPTIVWFRLDLRLRDNPALDAAVKRGGPVIPVFIWAPDEEGDWPPGAASRWWLHQSLQSLDARLRAAGSRLILRRGPSLETLRQLMVETGADKVHWNRRYEPALVARDAVVKGTLPSESFNSALLFEPWDIKTGGGTAYQVFTPFWKACVARQDTILSPTGLAKFSSPSTWPVSLKLADLALEDSVDWAAGFREVWAPGEDGAQDQLKRFLDRALNDYPTGRDRPDVEHTSRLSPHLHFGEVSPRQIWQATQRRPNAGAAWSFLRELGWREFAHHLLFHYPHTPTEPLRAEYGKFPWRADVSALRAWQRGRTGFALVDAGMRELWATGWMHNRVRMVAASFLVKDLLVSWQEGARWFWDTLVDADLANNTLGWQWTAGCGADAAPFFRIFNPTTQAEKFDPEERYIRHWVPEWGTPQYPKMIVDHGKARDRALDALATIKKR
jgi:deoxyribodipyrimidine photo-lyase